MEDESQTQNVAKPGPEITKNAWILARKLLCETGTYVKKSWGPGETPSHGLLRQRGMTNTHLVDLNHLGPRQQAYSICRRLSNALEDLQQCTTRTWSKILAKIIDLYESATSRRSVFVGFSMSIP